MVFEVVTVVIRQCSLNNCLRQMVFWVADGEEDKPGVTTKWCSFIFVMPRIDSIIKSIQLLSSVLQIH